MAQLLASSLRCRFPSCWGTSSPNGIQLRTNSSHEQELPTVPTAGEPFQRAPTLLERILCNIPPNILSSPAPAVYPPNGTSNSCNGDRHKARSSEEQRNLAVPISNNPSRPGWISFYAVALSILAFRSTLSAIYAYFAAPPTILPIMDIIIYEALIFIISVLLIPSEEREGGITGILHNQPSSHGLHAFNITNVKFLWLLCAVRVVTIVAVVVVPIVAKAVPVVVKAAVTIVTEVVLIVVNVVNFLNGFRKSHISVLADQLLSFLGQLLSWLFGHHIVTQMSPNQNLAYGSLVRPQLDLSSAARSSTTYVWPPTYNAVAIYGRSSQFLGSLTPDNQEDSVTQHLNLGARCSFNTDCRNGLHCFGSGLKWSGYKCVRSTTSNPFKVNNSLPYNKYVYLTTHNSFAIHGEPSHTGVPRLAFCNQEDSVTQQLNNGVRGLMLDTYEYNGSVWLCHSLGRKCLGFTAFVPLIDTLMEIGAFLYANPTEILTIILEDHVEAPNKLREVFQEAGLMKYWFPVSEMPQNGEDWPRVSDMVDRSRRLVVFTSMKSKEQLERIAHQWTYMVENQYVDDGMEKGKCSNRAESSSLKDRTKSLVVMNYFPTIPWKLTSTLQNSMGLNDMINTCYHAAGGRAPNFLVVDHYKRSDGGGALQATDLLNGKLLCGRDDVHSCSASSGPVLNNSN